MSLRLLHSCKSAHVLELSRDVSAWNQHLKSCFKQGMHEQVLHLYQQMRHAGLHPNASTFPCLISSCHRLSAVQLGEQLHASALQFGCGCDHYVGSSLVTFYAKCQKMENAERLFEEVSKRSVVSWTALLHGYARIGRSNKAVEILGQMQQDGIRPNEVTAMSLIPACVCLGEGECLHGFVVKLALDTDSLVGTSLVTMYLKCGAVGNGTLVFHELEDKNDVSWFVMVSGLAKNGFISDAVSFIKTMLHDLNLILDSGVLVNLVSACADKRDIEHGMWTHVYILKTGIEVDPFLGTSLINMYAKCGLLGLSLQIFEKLSERNVVSWNVLIYSYARQGFVKDVMKMFWRLNHAGFRPDSVTIKSCLLALASSSYYWNESQLGECFHCLSIKYGFFDSEIETANSILDFYVKVGNIKAVEELFSLIEGRRDTISWNCLMNGYVQNGYSEYAIMLFYQIKLAYLVPDSFTLSTFLAACARMGDVLIGEYMHGYLIKQGLVYFVIWGSFVGTTLVDMYAKCGNVASAYKVFEEIKVRETATWNAMIAGFSQNSYFREALAIFYDNLQDAGGLSMFDSAVGTAVSACGQLGCLEGGRCLHGYILKNGMEDELIVGNAILSMYSKCGILKEAELFFEKMGEKDTTSWTTMIAGYGVSGGVKDAVSLFEEMTKKNVEANRVTFLEVLWVCSHGGLVSEGWGYFEKMRTHYGIEPDVEHYCCMVDLLGRAGYLYEAYALIKSMKVEADAPIWGALLSACRLYGELELGQIAGSELFRVVDKKGKKSSYYVLLSNAYSAGGWWEDAARVREEEMNKTGGRSITKPPGWSRIETKFF